MSWPFEVDFVFWCLVATIHARDCQVNLQIDKTSLFVAENDLICFGNAQLPKNVSEQTHFDSFRLTVSWGVRLTETNA